MQYANVPRTVAVALSARLATLHELDSVYGIEDLYDLLEVHAVDAHNRNVLAAREDQ